MDVNSEVLPILVEFSVISNPGGYLLMYSSRAKIVDEFMETYRTLVQITRRIITAKIIKTRLTKTNWPASSVFSTHSLPAPQIGLKDRVVSYD
jgi:hypothetical protein